MILKQQVILNKFSDKKIKEITELNNKVSPDNLIYRYTGPTANAKFNEFDNALSLIDKIREGETSIADVKNDQRRFKPMLGELKKGNKEHRSKEQRDAIFNIEMVYKARENANKFYDDYSSMISVAKYAAIKGAAPLTLEIMLQRLPITLAQVKAGNNSENLLN